MKWQEKQPEVLARLEVETEKDDWVWLNANVDLECPDLETMDTATIRTRFELHHALNKTRLTRTYVWQGWLKVMVGEFEPVNGNVRSFWYQHVEGFFRSHGLFEPSPNEPPPADPYIQSIPPGEAGMSLAMAGRSAEDKEVGIMTELFGDFVEHHVFQYGGEFQFQQPINSKHYIGRDRAKYLYFTEKEGLWSFCESIYRTSKKGRCISVMASHGEPSYQTLEFLANELKAQGVAELIIGAMCDHDPWGFWIAWNLDHKLSSFCSKEKDKHGKLKPFFKVTTYLLTTADLFNADQIKNGRDLSGFHDKTLIDNWLHVTHGVHGKPIGLHIDVVNERLRRQRVDNWLEDLIDHLTPPFPVIPKNSPKSGKKLCDT